jgi:hypothetical protein
MRTGRAVLGAFAVVLALTACKGKEKGSSASGGALQENLEQSKNAEAKVNLGMLAKGMQAAYDAESLDTAVLAPGHATAVLHTLCAGSSKPVPESLASVDGKKYQSSRAEWTADAARDAGFACAKFDVSDPQYFQYELKSDGTEFTAYARRPVGTEIVEFSLTGKVVNGTLNVAPSVSETRKAR